MKKTHHGGNVDAVARRLAIQPDQLLDFSANINPFGYPMSLKADLVAALDLLPQYPDPEYYNLRQSIANHYQLSAEEVLVSNGGAQMLDEVIRALSPTAGLVLAPTFGEYEHYFSRLKVPVYHFHLKPQTEFKFELSELIDYLERHPQIDVLCLTNPNNPSGGLITNSDLRALADYCHQSQRKLILDEAFVDLTIPQVSSFITQLNSTDPIVVVHSVTKFYAIPGLRLGYAVTKDQDLLRAIQQQQNPWSVNALADVFGQQMFDQSKFQVQTRQWLEDTQPKLMRALKAFPALHVFPSHTNFILFQVALTDLRERLLKHRIMIRQCDDYEGLDKTYYRVAVKSEANNQILVNALGQVLKEANLV
ncbi:threonine-phosphate decarboxylase CobD [Lactobacillus sp. 3B(2020)]|uniref:threonine-phosphate decarboxylase CobD n=1 Tax=Lactobacillus sp. 3B(2020) TaxID=2695882 RepID=UPI0015DE332B|nr:threonine-phosphate decarboxylase CobD [Lactobacillus sp. 3B(2020)]QLL69166.1 threonine-phosphate decarboxylase [Lactobacillus sp. 3B(2020)]